MVIYEQKWRQGEKKKRGPTGIPNYADGVGRKVRPSLVSAAPRELLTCAPGISKVRHRTFVATDHCCSYIAVEKSKLRLHWLVDQWRFRDSSQSLRGKN